MRLAILLALSLSACHTSPPAPVPVLGTPADLARLAGNWSGDYQADDGSRSGSIQFRLEAGSDTAFGDVIMIPSGWGNALEPYDRPSSSAPERAGPQTLTIRFVRVSGGEVAGQLQPYRDPNCGCRLLTGFRGKLEGDRLKGTYQSYHQEGGATVTGRWAVERQESR